MARTVAERDRMLAFASSTASTLLASTALVAALVPGALSDIEATIIVVVLCLLILAAAAALRRRTSPIPVVITLAAAVIGIAVVGLSGETDGLGATAVVALLAAASSSSAFLLGAEPRRRIILVAGFAVLMAVTVPTLLAVHGQFVTALLIAIGSWAFCTGISVWVARVVPETIDRIEGMSDAYRTERQASELEARRRQSARLLHDTVLATLTLLAHSGRGVGEQALRSQAAEDAALLRQLRLGYTPDPAASGDYRLRQVQESTLGNTLETVKQRFQRMGLDVAWHGTGHVLLPSETLDAFLLALAECLENVRRHSGETQAHVTITDDDVTVRAMVTDSGIGFDTGSVSPGRLGFTESIVARVRDVGGNARLFSAPGSGTTVVLEVPKA
ncbi:sensor histidine kinase [Humibacter sp.]|jgi:signal transduction histidine kinase|uniref:sensor histidine kinase n=1 Tax=Humibacter sp. TaxID=1940291 RepID=UPI002C068C05|nr:ATP-binding protein [Humibacter sp.]HVX06539.1 ATP-binding protein [Humibacter sp.]